MPSRKYYKDEKSYQLELKKVRDKRREEASKKISIIEVKAKGPLPEVCRISDCLSDMSNQYSKAADRVATELRKHLLRRWHTDFEGDCIITVEHIWKDRGKVMYYTIELTSYGAILQKDWLKDELRAQGLTISGYQTERDLVAVIKN